MKNKLWKLSFSDLILNFFSWKILLYITTKVNWQKFIFLCFDLYIYIYIYIWYYKSLIITFLLKTLKCNGFAPNVALNSFKVKLYCWKCNKIHAIDAILIPLLGILIIITALVYSCFISIKWQNAAIELV